MTGSDPLDDIDGLDDIDVDAGQATADSAENDGRGSLLSKFRESAKSAYGRVMPDKQPSLNGDSWGVRLGEMIGGQLGQLAANLSLATARVVPFSERFFRALYRLGLRGIHGKSGCDYLGMIQVGGEIKPVPVDWDHEKQHFENRHGDFWKAPSEGEYQYRMAGKVPAIWASSTSNHVGSHMQAQVAEALDLGRSLDVYESANVRVDGATIDASDSDGQTAATDGGGLTNFTVTGMQPGPFADRVVPLTSTDDYDARAVSLEKYYETYPEVVDSEEMKMQEQRGELAINDRDYGKMAMKMLLIAGAIIAAVELGPPLIQVLFGGGGGGGSTGGLIPVMLNPAGLI